LPRDGLASMEHETRAPLQREAHALVALAAE
jgi:hypothetical protein